MSEKTKRNEKSKGNSRRVTLIQLILLIAIIGTLAFVGINLLRPKGAEIVFIAADEDGIENVWIADLNNPDNPRQLTHLDAETFISPVPNLQVIEENRTAVFSTGQFVPEEFWQLNLNTGNIESIFTCDDTIINCPSVTVGADGNWLAYLDRTIVEDDRKTISAYIHNLENAETIRLYTLEGIPDGVPFPYLDWFGTSSQIVYQPDLINNPLTFELYDVYEEQVTQTLVMNVLKPVFTRDGSFYGLWAASSDDPITLYNIDNSVAEPVEAVAEFEEERLISGLMDWNPDNEQALVSHGTLWDTDNYYNELSLYNALSGEKNILFSNVDGLVYAYSVFNTDGSQFLYFTRNQITNEFSSFIIYDLETAEETVLPLSGREPLWVSSGN